MKSIQRSLFLAALCLLLLAHSNPNSKGEFVTFVSRKTTNLVCESQSLELCRDFCSVAKPLTFQATRALFSLYTQKPKNYLLFTAFRVDLPGLTIRAIGIANTYLLSPVNTDFLKLCELTNGASGYHQQCIQEIEENSV